MFLLLQFSVGILLLLPVFPFIAKYTVQDGSYFFAPNIHPSWVAIAVKHQTDTDEYALGHDIVFTTNHLAGRKHHRCAHTKLRPMRQVVTTWNQEMMKVHLKIIDSNNPLTLWNDPGRDRWKRIGSEIRGESTRSLPVVNWWYFDEAPVCNGLGRGRWTNDREASAGS